MKRQFLLFGLFFIALMLIFRGCGSDTNLEATLAGNDLGIAVLDTEYNMDDLVSVTLKNNTDQDLRIENDCPREPLNVYRYKNGEWIQLEAKPEITCESKDDFALQPGQEMTLDYTSWNHALFHQIGRYKIGATVIGDEENKEYHSNEFTVTGKSWLGYVWGTFLYQPIYNSLIYLVSIVPGNSLGIAIILLTIILRSILFIPSQRGLESQRKLQELQPRIKKIQEKYKNNQEKIAQETFALYKEHKVNPFGSCLPLLLQLPILIALFYVIRTGLNPDNVYLLYEPLKGFDLTLINSNFLGILELQQRNIFVLPLIVAGLQFFQLKLSLASKKKKKVNTKKKDKKGAGEEMQMAGQMMTYIMPAMIALFTASVPSGVGLYWGTSTIFGIAQQLCVNKRVAKKSNKNKAEVRVIEKK
ncbi:membrane protein insertase YidC [Candidatus Peregrinibacteria bacterium]|nr:membrane protein insertase YidC [Candidatus Peregrinibacteria bacterium]